MSESADSEPSLQLLRAVQTQLNDLDDLSESQPGAVIAATDNALATFAGWPHTDVYAWTLALRAKCFRLLDNLPAVLEAVDTGLDAKHDGGRVAGQLHLEAGMTLNQFGEPLKAAEHLRQADEAFDRAHDDAGRAWAQVSLAEAHSASGYPADPEPLLKQALQLADGAGDQRAARRAWKQLAVVLRHRGDIPNALSAIQHALDGATAGQVRANYELELGHLLAWTGDFTRSDEVFEDVAAAYAEYGDQLGLANVQRALASNALLLGRVREGTRRLNSAADLYRSIGNRTGLGYVLRDRAIVQLDADHAAQAIADVEEGLACFRASPDTLGLAAMLRSAAQVRHRAGDDDGSRAALVEARILTTDGANPLAEAGIHLIEAEYADTPLDRLHLAQTAAELYREMGVTTGEATALARVAQAYQALDATADSVAAVRASAAAVRRARRQVSDPGRRADHDFAIRDVITDLLTVALSLGNAEAKKEAADLLTDAAPLGLRTTIKEGALDQTVLDLVNRAVGLPTRLDGTQRNRHLLQQLGALLATVPTHQAPDDIEFSDVVAAHPEAGLIVIGAPTRDGNLPIAWTVPGRSTQLDQTHLGPDDVDAIDAIGYALAPDATRCLWDPAERAWQQNLTNLFLPAELQDWLTVEGRDLVVYLPPVLSHTPVEALLINGRPLGVLTAVTRIPVPGGQNREPQIEQLVAYLDPHFPWTAEKAVLDTWTHDEHAFRQSLAPNSLIIASCHGEQAIRAESALVASNGERVIDAFDLIAQDLTGSVLLLEACYAGRYLGTRTGEQLSLATVGLLANASAVVAAQFALPADNNCTGVIMATCLREIRAGTPPAEAMRRARAAFWHDRPAQLRRPGEAEALMPGDAPWAWAGLCVYGR